MRACVRTTGRVTIIYFKLHESFIFANVFGRLQNLVALRTLRTRLIYLKDVVRRLFKISPRSISLSHGTCQTVPQRECLPLYVRDLRKSK